MYRLCITEVAYDGIGQRFREDKGRDGPPRKERGLYDVSCHARACVFVCVCVPAHVCMCVCECVDACVRACVRACMRACERACVRACV